MSKITKGIEALNAGREALKKSLGFVSKVDEAAQALPRTKGTGAEFMKELEKQPGVKKAEIADRRLDKIKAMPKMTKEEFIKQIEEHPAPQLKEKVRSFDNEEEIERLAREKFLKENYYTGSLRQEGIQKWKSSNPLFKESYRQDIVNSEAGMALEPKYQDYTLPGGENYREVLIKLPVSNKKIDDARANYEAASKEFQKDKTQTNWAKLKIAEQELDVAKITAPDVYRSSHWEGDPNVLAHVRVSDRWGPNDENVLHIEEIQSDWHQEGRKKGYQNLADTENLNKIVDQLSNKYGIPADEQRKFDRLLGVVDKDDLRILKDASETVRSGVPDAPFKKNWHELVMKRMLNYAAENGYDKVVITPGIEQAKRFDLSKQVDELLYKKNEDGTYQLSAQARGRGNMIGEAIPENKLEDYVGKDVAKKIIENQGKEVNLGGSGSVSQPSDMWGSLTGIDLEVGGEGMKGFYDKILPDYLNNFGKQYGATVQQMKLPTPPHDSTLTFGYPGAEDYVGGRITWSEFLEQNPRAADEFYTTVHSFDITPQMREEIKKGLPLYQAAPAIPAIPAAESLIPEQTEEGMKKGGSAEMKPTPRSKALGTAADFAKWLEESSKAQFGYKNPATEAISDFLGIPAVARTLEKASYGEPITNVGKANVPLIPDDTAEAAMTLAPAAIGAGKLATKGALALGRKGEKLAEQVVPGIMERGGLPAQALSDLATGSRSQIWIGPKAKTFDNRRLNEAVEMKKAGATDEEIWAKTGTYKGVDGVWRQEISDQQARFLTPEQRKEELEQVKEAVQTLKSKIAPTKQKDLFPKSLSEAKKGIKEDIEILKGDIKNRQRNPRTQGMQAGYMFEHPELYKAYPELLNLMITTEGSGLGLGTQASLSVIPRHGQLPGSMAMDIYDAGLRNNPTSSALHEMQHAVQTIEGMHPGGNPTMAFADPITNEIYKRKLAEFSKPGSFEEFQSANRFPEDKARQAYDEYVKSYKAYITPAIDREIQKDAAMEYYRRLGGEAEARAVQERQMMGPSERRHNFPYSSYDILPEDIIVKPPREYKKGGRVKVSANQDTMFMDVADKKLKRK